MKMVYLGGSLRKHQKKQGQGDRKEDSHIQEADRSGLSAVENKLRFSGEHVQLPFRFDLSR